MPESYVGTTDIFNTKIKRPRDIVDEVLSAATADFIEAEKKVEEARRRFRKAPAPRYDVQQIIDNVRSALGEHTGIALAESQPLPAEAEFYLKRYLGRIGKTDKDLQGQIAAIWPDLGPGRELSAEEKAELLDMQTQLEELVANLTETIDDSLNVLHSLMLKEYKIVHGTAADGIHPIRSQAEDFTVFMENHIRAVWGKLTGKVSWSDRETFKYTRRRWPL